MFISHKRVRNDIVEMVFIAMILTSNASIIISIYHTLKDYFKDYAVWSNSTVLEHFNESCLNHIEANILCSSIYA